MAEGGFKKPEHAGQAGEEKGKGEAGMHTHMHTHNETHTHVHHHGETKDMGGQDGKETKKDESTHKDTAAEKKDGEKKKSMSEAMYDHKSSKAKTAGNAANKGY